MHPLIQNGGSSGSTASSPTSATYNATSNFFSTCAWIPKEPAQMKCPIRTRILLPDNNEKNHHVRVVEFTGDWVCPIIAASSPPTKDDTRIYHSSQAHVETNQTCFCQGKPVLWPRKEETKSSSSISCRCLSCASFSTASIDFAWECNQPLHVDLYPHCWGIDCQGNCIEQSSVVDHAKNDQQTGRFQLNREKDGHPEYPSMELSSATTTTTTTQSHRKDNKKNNSNDVSQGARVAQSASLLWYLQFLYWTQNQTDIGSIHTTSTTFFF